jgi:hypothetical protein
LDKSVEAKAETKSKIVPLKLTNDINYSDGGSDLTLSHLRDDGLSLNQIRQQAINIFLEATRHSCDCSSKFEILMPSKISDKDFEAGSEKHAYLSPRVQWLVYYVGTIEPIISLFTQDVNDTRAGASKLLVPQDTKAKMILLWHEWEAGIDGVNKELTGINSLIDDGKPENKALAKHAIAMFNYTENLERTREKAFIAIRDSAKHNSAADKVSIP